MIVDLIKLFNTENFFQHLFTKFPKTEEAVQRSFKLGDTWSIKNADEINAILNRWPRQPEIEVDSGLMDVNQNILPIELETTPKVYTLVQVPHYCYRARYSSYRMNAHSTLPRIKVLVISIGINQEYIDLLDGPTCMVRALYPTNMDFILEVLEEENPAFYALQVLLKSWSETFFSKTLDSQSISQLGKVFITCWVLLLGDKENMAEIEASVKKIIENKFGSEEEFIDRAIHEEGAEVLKLFKPEQLSALTARQIRGLTLEQLKSLTPEQLKGLTPEQLKGLAPEQLKGLAPEQLKGLTPEQLQALTPEQVKKLSAEQLSNVDPNVLRKALELAERK